MAKRLSRQAAAALETERKKKEEATQANQPLMPPPGSTPTTFQYDNGAGANLCKTEEPTRNRVREYHPSCIRYGAKWRNPAGHTCVMAELFVTPEGAQTELTRLMQGLPEAHTDRRSTGLVQAGCYGFELFSIEF